ncbi:BON domain-containing protein [Usitatibacter palustris]|uniref:BON domain-containing protein n=1 Tax=Usitatibacter palustris TaxID=2732487 RepID=A0A6M4H8F8_9PROT|nr:BON domain-containing protein [Usitatibacter palustris]QJR15896.1 hypothetical protein DSM104440_02722 [Usitatibacter palustris]
MKNQFTIRNATLALALAAVGATSWAATQYLVIDPDTQEPAIIYRDEEPILLSGPNELTGEPVVIAEPIEGTPPSTENLAVPVVTPAPVAERQPPITIEERRLSTDERIQMEVMDKLAVATDISGKLGVESQDAVVTLSGYTLNGSQREKAGRYARSVEGVKYVQNDIRPQMSRW